MENLQNRLKDLRREKDVMQKDIANYLDISSSAYGFYEQGKRIPTPDVLMKLADYFQVSIDYLLGKTDSKKQHVNNSNEKDIEKAIDELMEQQGLMLSGEPLNEEDIFLLRNSIRNTLEFAKSLKKKK